MSGPPGARTHHETRWTRAMRARRAPIAPQVRGRVGPRILAALAADGWHVHRVGRAAYLHSPDDRHHLILGVWPRGATAPSWSDRLGRPSAGYARRLERTVSSRPWLRMARDQVGRFTVPLPWWRWPIPAPYHFEPGRLGLADEERTVTEAHNRAVRARLGLVAAS